MGIQSLVKYVAVVAAVVAGAADRASASLVTLNFSGTITTLNDVGNSFGGQVKLGDAFTGSLVYDTATNDSNSDPNVGNYLYANRFTNTPFVAPLGMIIHVGGATIQPNYGYLATVDVYNNQLSPVLGVSGDGIQAIQVTSFDGTTVVPVSQTVLALFDRSQSVFSSDVLPISLSTSSFSEGIIQVVVSGGTSGSNSVVALEGTINLQAVPEPGSVALLAVAGPGMLAYARRRRVLSDRPSGS